MAFIIFYYRHNVKLNCFGEKYIKMDEDNKSDTSSNNGSFGDASKSIYEAYIDIAPNEQQWKKDKVCHICKKKFGSKISLINEKKFRCKFCWRGTCGDCSKARAMHPDFEKPQRICNACFQKSKENRISEGYSIELNRARSEKDLLELQLESLKRETQQSIKEKGQLEEKLEQVQKEVSLEIAEQQLSVDALKSQRDEISKKFEGLKSSLTTTEEERNEKDRILDELEKELFSLKNNKCGEKDEIGDLRNLLAEKQDENVRLLRKLDEKKAPPPGENNKQRKRREKEEKFREEIEELLDQIKAVQDENKLFIKEISDINTEISSIDVKKQNLQDELEELEFGPIALQRPGVRQSMIQIEEQKIKELKEIIQDQQQKIDKLKSEIQKSKPINDREMSSADIN
ncbi:unnamed protein product [Blepharisma stoltei]|uniref:FYVE-type domain-containing protein n=1 Tax=Blepharisma stoltei TaxID=1481888 RepID=A0AAU9IGS2_9CILI|nr:unnamed protein product [Blepharisma stoltei]